MTAISADVRARAKKIKLFLMDCDGVLTDGRIYFNDRGEETKAFDIKDGLGIVLLHRAGIVTGVISGRESGALQRRAEELSIRFLKMRCEDKAAEFDRMISQAGATAEETAFVGDDLPDIELMKKAGLAIAVADAAPEVIACAHFITEKKGGRGAVREAANLILNSR